MPDVRLHRAQPQRAFGSAVQAVHGQQRLRLDRVAERRSRAVCLHRVHFGGGYSRVLQRLLDDPLLGGSVGCGQPVGGAVLVDGRPAHHSQHAVALGPCVREALHGEDADALRPPGAVGRRREGLAAPVRRQAALAAELHEHSGARHDGHTARQGQVALAVPQRLDRQVQRDQRRGAGGVDGDGGAFQAEGVGEAAGEHAGRVAGQGEAADLLGDVEHVGEAVSYTNL